MKDKNDDNKLEFDTGEPILVIFILKDYTSKSECQGDIGFTVNLPQFSKVFWQKHENPNCANPRRQLETIFKSFYNNLCTYKAKKSN